MLEKLGNTTLTEKQNVVSNYNASFQYKRNSVHNLEARKRIKKVKKFEKQY